MPGEAGTPWSFTSRERVALEDAIRYFLSELLFDQVHQRVRCAHFVVAFGLDYKTSPAGRSKQQDAEDGLPISAVAGVFARQFDGTVELRGASYQSCSRASVKTEAV